MCLECEDVVLGYRCVGVFIVESVVKCSLRVLWQQLFCSSGSVASVVCLSCEDVVLASGCDVFFYSGICLNRSL